MTRRFLFAFLALSIVAGIAVIVSTYHARSDETPSYTVEAERPSYEIRRYAPRIVAEVMVPGAADEAMDSGFAILANYISGNNTEQMTIEMTSPVERQAIGNQWLIRFTMPAKFTLATLPQPNDERVNIRELPETVYAATRFSGNPRPNAIERRMAELWAALQNAGHNPIDAAPIYARYDPPWVLPFLRRNEILVELPGA